MDKGEVVCIPKGVFNQELRVVTAAGKAYEFRPRWADVELVNELCDTLPFWATVEHGRHWRYVPGT